MFSMLTNIAKAATATILTPVALVADVLTLPASAMDAHRSPFGRTEKMLDAAGDAAMEAVLPSKE